MHFAGHNLKELVLHRSRCYWADHHVIWGEARLYPEWIVVRGWGLRGHLLRRIMLKEVARVGWHGRAGLLDANLTLYLKNGRRFSVHVRAAALWRLHLTRRLELLAARAEPNYRHCNVYRAEATQVSTDGASGVPPSLSLGDGAATHSTGPSVSDM